MADVDISLEAQDAASAVLDTAAENIQRSATTITSAANEVGTSGQKIGISFGGIGKAASALLAAYAAVLSARSLFQFGRESAEAFKVQQEASEGLEAALLSQAASRQRLAGSPITTDEGMEAASAAAEQATATHEAFAAELQRLTTVGDEVSLGIMRQAALLGIESSQLDDVTAAAIGVSEATGIGLNESLKKVNAAINGNADAFGEYIPAIKDVASEEQKLMLVQELASRGLEQKQASLDRLQGAEARASGAVGDLMESIGALLEPILIVVNQGLAVFAETAQVALVPAVDMVNSSMESLGGWTMWAARQAVAAVTAIEVGFTNWQTVSVIAFQTLELAYVKFVEDTKHTFLVVAPAYIMWFADNFVNILSDMGNAVLTVLQNLGHNIGETLFAIFDFISSGFEGGLDGLSQRLSNAIFVGLMDGFEAQTAALPDIAARQITQREQSLAESIGQMGSNLGKQFSDKFNSRIKAIEKDFLNKKKIEIDLQEKTGASKSAAGSSTQLQATEGRLLTRGRAEDPLSEMVANGRKQIDLQKQTLKATKDNKPKEPAPAGDTLKVEVVT